MKRLYIIWRLLRAKKYYIVYDLPSGELHRKTQNLTTNEAVDIINDLSVLLNDSMQGELNLKEVNKIIQNQ